MLKCCSSRTNLQLQSVTADTLQRNINNQKLFEALFEWAIHPQRWNSVPANSSTPQIKPGKKKVKIMLAKKDNSVSNSSLFRYIYIVKYHAPGGEGGGRGGRGELKVQIWLVQKSSSLPAVFCTDFDWLQDNQHLWEHILLNNY